MKTTAGDQSKGRVQAEVYLKLDAQNRITLKKPTAKIYAVEVDEAGVIKLTPCRLVRQA